MAFTVRLNEETEVRLNKVAEKLDRSRNWIVNEALGSFLDAEERYIAEIEAAIKEADAGDFATEEEIARLTSKYKPKA